MHPSGFSGTDAAREKPSKKGRLETDSESEVSETEYNEYADLKRFRTVPKHDEFKWYLPENLAKYKSDLFSRFIPEKYLSI